MNAYPQYKESGVEWIGEIPAHWECCLTKHKLTKITDGAHISPETENGVHPFISTVNVNEGEIDFNCCLLTSQKSFDLLSSQGCRPEVGDVLFSKDGTIGKTVVVGNTTSFVVASSLIILTPVRNMVASKYLDYLLQSRIVIEQINSFVKGSALRRLSLLNFKKIYGVFPPLAEQTAIATYLDRKTTQIDTLIAKKQRLIELLREERTAIISHAVTKGLDATVRLKESGVEWIGEIPEHWEVKRTGYIANVVRGSTPRPAGDPKYFNGHICPWITVAEITKDDNKYLDGTSTCLTKEGQKYSRYLEVGAFVLTNSGATLGVPKILAIAGCINDGSVALLDIAKTMSDDFLYYFFTHMTKNYRELMALSSGQPNLNTEIVKSTAISVPPLAEQTAIATYLDEKMAQIDALIAKTERQVELLEEYRTALISSVVTGKVDVREEVM